MKRANQMPQERHALGQKVKRYFLMGVVGVGKSSLRDEMRSRLPEASIYEEWPEAMPEEVKRSMRSLDVSHIRGVQAWIFGQLAEKNALIRNDPKELIIADRSPLDTFAFYPRSRWQIRAQEMLAAIEEHESTNHPSPRKSARPSQPSQPSQTAGSAREAITTAGTQEAKTIVSGELILLKGDIKTISARMDKSRGYTEELLEDQQNAFLYLADWLSAYYGYQTHILEVGECGTEKIADRLVRIINDYVYSPLDMQRVVAGIADGRT